MTLLHVLFVLVVILPLTSGFAAQGHWELSMSDVCGAGVLAVTCLGYEYDMSSNIMS